MTHVDPQLALARRALGEDKSPIAMQISDVKYVQILGSLILLSLDLPSVTLCDRPFCEVSSNLMLIRNQL